MKRIHYIFGQNLRYSNIELYVVLPIYLLLFLLKNLRTLLFMGRSVLFTNSLRSRKKLQSPLKKGDSEGVSNKKKCGL